MPAKSHPVSAVAERYDVDDQTVRDWINAGDLAAVNVARAGARRKTWRVTDEAMAAFERSRRAVPVAMPGREVRTAARRRKKLAGTREYF
jgi:hypothetical protein